MAAGGTLTLFGLSSLQWLFDEKTTAKKMPVLFVGHGSPMNAIEENVFSREWSKVAGTFEKPKAILCVSAHWLTNGTYVTAVENPVTIHDFGRFPQALFDVQYPAPGLPELAKETQKLFPEDLMHLDFEWGLDHGTWSVLKHMYPLADVPVIQVSIDYRKPASYHFEIAQYLKKLRNKGVLIVGSGNIVHNLRMVAWDKINSPFGYDWAIEANEKMKALVTGHEFSALFDYQKYGQAFQLAVPTPDHYYPLMYTLGTIDKNEEIKIFNDIAVAGSLTMTSFIAGV